MVTIPATRAAKSSRISTTPDKPKRKRRPIRWFAYLALLPLLLLIGVFAYYPAVSGVFWSFFNWVPAGDSTFRGFGNYADMMRDGIWWQSFRNLAVIFVFGILSWFIPLIAAELLISLRSARWQYVIRTMLIIPMAFPGVVTALVWGFFYQPNSGVINKTLSSLGLGSLAHNWLGSTDSALLALLFIGFPFIAGLPFLIFYASLQNIPMEVLEAAELDGVGRIRRFWTIDLPLMASQVRILFFLAIIGTLQYGFTAYLLTGGGPNNATTVPVIRMIGEAFSAANWGYAATLSTTLFVITMLFSAVVVFVRRKDSGATDGGEL